MCSFICYPMISRSHYFLDAASVNMAGLRKYLFRHAPCTMCYRDLDGTLVYRFIATDWEMDSTDEWIRPLMRYSLYRIFI
jgi:hypothetical protein